MIYHFVAKLGWHVRRGRPARKGELIKDELPRHKNEERRRQRNSPRRSDTSRSHHSRKSNARSPRQRRRQDPYQRPEPWSRRSPSMDSHYRSGEHSDTDYDTVSETASESSHETTNRTRNRHVRHDRRNMNMCNVKSGITAKATSKVRREMTYPHFTLGQTSPFVPTDIAFEQLIYDQFVAGEITTISRTTSRNEKHGRIRLLQNISHWKLRNAVSWIQLRSVYALILRDIENEIITWHDDFNVYQHLLTDRPPVNTVRPRENRPNETWFCRQFQRPEGCSKESPHNIKWGNKDKWVQHICAKCWLRDKVKRYHAETSNECPNKQST